MWGLDLDGMSVPQIFCLFELKQKGVINPVRPPGNYELLPLICFPQIMLRRETTAVWILFISYISLTVV